jgi:hypothetical protein
MYGSHLHVEALLPQRTAGMVGLVRGADGVSGGLEQLIFVLQDRVAVADPHRCHRRTPSDEMRLVA